jgi:hypothetical protein
MVGGRGPRPTGAFRRLSASSLRSLVSGSGFGLRLGGPQTQQPGLPRSDSGPVESQPRLDSRSTVVPFSFSIAPKVDTSALEYEPSSTPSFIIATGQPAHRRVRFRLTRYEAWGHTQGVLPSRQVLPEKLEMVPLLFESSQFRLFFRSQWAVSSSRGGGRHADRGQQFPSLSSRNANHRSGAGVIPAHRHQGERARGSAGACAAITAFPGAHVSTPLFFLVPTTSAIPNLKR